MSFQIKPGEEIGIKVRWRKQKYTDKIIGELIVSSALFIAAFLQPSVVNVVLFLLLGSCIFFFVPSKVRVLSYGLGLPDEGELIHWSKIRRARVEPLYFADTAPLNLRIETDTKLYDSKIIDPRDYFQFTRRAGFNSWVIRGAEISLAKKDDTPNILIRYKSPYYSICKRFLWWSRFPAFILAGVFMFWAGGVPANFPLLIFGFIVALCCVTMVPTFERDCVFATSTQLRIDGKNVEYKAGDTSEIVAMDQIRTIDKKSVSKVVVTLVDGRKVTLSANYLLLYQTLVFLTAGNNYG